MDIPLEKKPFMVRHKYWIIFGTLFMLFLLYLLFSTFGLRKLRVDGETINIVDVKKERFLEFVDTEGIVKPWQTIRVNNSESGILPMKYEYIVIFWILSLLIIISALMNYLILFVTRMRLMTKDLMIRKINGATNADISLQLFIEVFILVFLSMFIGSVFIELLIPYFKDVAQIKVSDSFI